MKYEPKLNKQGNVICTVKLRDSEDILINNEYKQATTVLIGYTYEVANSILNATNDVIGINNNYKLVEVKDDQAIVEVKCGAIEYIIIPVTMLDEVKEDDITRKDTNVPSTTRRTKTTK